MPLSGKLLKNNTFISNRAGVRSLSGNWDLNSQRIKKWVESILNKCTIKKLSK